MRRRLPRQSDPMVGIHRFLGAARDRMTQFGEVRRGHGDDCGRIAHGRRRPHGRLLRRITAKGNLTEPGNLFLRDQKVPY